MTTTRVPISALPAAGAITGAELVPALQDGQAVAVEIANLEGPAGTPGTDGESPSIFVQNDEPSTAVLEGSLWIDADSAANDLYQLQSGVWVDTGLNLKGAPGAGSGDVVGPAGALDGALVLFDGVTGLIIKDSTIVPSANVNSILSAANYAAIRALLDLEAGTDFYSIAAADAAFQPLDSDLTSWAAITRAAGFDTFVASPTAANFASLVTGESYGLTNAELAAIAGLTSAADKFPYFTGSGTAALADLSSAMRTFLTTPSAANFASVVSDDLFSLADAELGALAGLTSAADKVPYFTGSGTAALADLSSNMRTFMTTPSAANFATLVSDDAFSLADAELGALAGLTSAANKIPRFTGSGTADLLDFKDEDNMASDSATALPSQQSVKAYADTKQPLDSDLTSWAGVTRATGFDTFAATPSSANLKSLVTDETGSGGALVFATSPVLTTPDIGTPSAGTLTNCTGLPAAGVVNTAIVTSVENQACTGGCTVTEKALSNPTNGSTVTLDMGDRPIQTYTNNVAGHTLAPGTVHGMCLVDITNGASAGTITTSGWTKKSGDAFTTTNGHKFRCHCSVGTAGSLLVVQALQ